MHPNNIAQALSSALANPYTQYSSHYAQALAKVSNPKTTPEGYTLSAAYTPQHEKQHYPRPTSSQSQHHVVQPRQSQSSSWFQPGSHRCSYRSCTFTGSKKSLEVHMMDRHLIYPPGWEQRQKRPEWDADPSLKGKPISIQGTNVNLDTPEALEAWIAERKKRWPTSQRVADKKRKLEEAIERGQILPQEFSFARKRARRDEVETQKARSHRGTRGVERSWRGRGKGRGMASNAPIKAASHTAPQPDTAEDSGDDGAPEVASSRAPVSANQIPEEVSLTKDAEGRGNPKLKTTKLVERTQCRTPKKPPHNPFASRPTLLRNLLLPEIRVTISNLSQAIRFLVDNDFLDGVELAPGDAEKGQPIQVLEQFESRKNCD